MKLIQERRQVMPEVAVGDMLRTIEFGCTLDSQKDFPMNWMQGMRKVWTMWMYYAEYLRG